MPSQQEGWRGTRSWEGTPPGQLTPTGQSAIPYHMTSCPVYKLRGVGQEGRITARELIGHQLASGEQLHCASLVLYILILLVVLLYYYYYYHHHYFSFLSVLLNCLYLNPRVLFFFRFSPPSHWVGGVSERLCGA